MKKAILTILCGILIIGIPAKAVEPEPVLIVEDITPYSEVAQEWLVKHGVNVPEDIRWECEAAGNCYSVCPELLMAIGWKESRYVRDAKAGNCIGIMQINKKVHADRLSWYGIDSYDIHAQVWAAASLVRDLGEQYGTDGESADAATILAAYRGEDNPGSYMSSYTKEVLKVSEMLERAGGK